jgi:hypothetical protein
MRPVLPPRLIMMPGIGEAGPITVCSLASHVRNSQTDDPVTCRGANRNRKLATGFAAHDAEKLGLRAFDAICAHHVAVVWPRRRTAGSRRRAPPQTLSLPCVAKACAACRGSITQDFWYAHRNGPDRMVEQMPSATSRRARIGMLFFERDPKRESRSVLATKKLDQLPLRFRLFHRQPLFQHRNVPRPPSMPPNSAAPAIGNGARAPKRNLCDDGARKKVDCACPTNKARVTAPWDIIKTPDRRQIAARPRGRWAAPERPRAGRATRYPFTDPAVSPAT